MAQKRIDWVDNAKGIGILLVIIGHTQMTEDIHAVIYSFHLPLFFLLSGIFLFTKERSWREELSRKAKGLLVPFFWFNLICFSFDFVKTHLEMKFGLQPSLGVADGWMFLQGLLGGDRTSSYLWFLPCLFFAQCLLLFFVQGKKHVFTVGAGLALAGCLVHHFIGRPLPFSIDNAFFAASFISVGIAVRGWTFHYRYDVYLTALLLYVCFAYLSIRSTGGTGIDMFDCRYGNYFFFYGAALTAIFLVLSLAHRLPHSRVLSFLGRNTLVIYCTHKMFLVILIIILKRVSLPVENPETLSLVRSLVQTLGACVLCVPVVYAVNRYFPWLIGQSRAR